MERSVPPPSPLDTTSDSNDSQDGRASSKKRKPTYYMRKEEKTILEQQVAELQERIRQLEATHHVAEKRALDQSVALNTVLSADVEANNLALAGSQSLISAEMISRFRTPLDHYIYLSADLTLRRQSLLSLKPLKIDAATRLVRERMQFLDIRQPHRHCESTVLPNGDFVVSLFDVTPFDGYTNAKPVFDTFVDFVMSQEISISEKLGILSIRETDDHAETSVAQCRMLVTIAPGLEIESNLTMCSRFHESPDGISPSFGVGTVDYIDKDDLYSYQPSTRLRKDLSACAFITQTAPPTTPTSANDHSDQHQQQQPGVSMARCATIRLHRAQFPINKQMQLVAQASVESWSDVMPKVMQERLGLL